MDFLRLANRFAEKFVRMKNNCVLVEWFCLFVRIP